MATQNSNSKDIKYLSKDFSDFRQALIEYAKSYYPNAYNDFSVASPGSMFIDMAAYVGDVMSFYLDNQIQETFLQYAKQKDSIMSLAYMLGYFPKVTSAATVTLDIYQTIPATSPYTGQTNNTPDWRYGLVISEGMQVQTNDSAKASFYIPQNVDFTVSSSTDPTEITVYETDTTGKYPLSYLLKKQVEAISGELKTITVSTPTNAQKFFTTTISDSNIIEVVSVVDSSGDKWYEVPYLAQDFIMTSKKNEFSKDPNYYSSSLEVPYLLEIKKVPKRFVTRFTSNGTLELQFGAGRTATDVFSHQNEDETNVPNPYKVGMGNLEGRSLMQTYYNPANFLNTKAYGLSPNNTTLTVTYLVGGGYQANVPSNTITNIGSFTSSFYGGVLPDSVLETKTLASLAVNNPSASAGGGDGDTVEQIRQNALLQFPTQMRAVTEQDYLATIYTMPAKFGNIAKAHVSKDINTFHANLQNRPELADNSVLSAYILAYDGNKNLIEPSIALKQNLRTYLSNYRMLTDSINIKSGYVINIGVDFDIVLRPNYSSREVLANCLVAMKDYFNIDKWQINQPILLSDIYTTLDKIVGVQTVKKLEIFNLSDADGNYSQYGYDIAGATINGIVYPSLDPSIFEVKYPEQDIFGRVVSF